jgi:hypothetical protein
VATPLVAEVIKIQDAEDAFAEAMTVEGQEEVNAFTELRNNEGFSREGGRGNPRRRYSDLDIDNSVDEYPPIIRGLRSVLRSLILSHLRVPHRRRRPPSWIGYPSLTCRRVAWLS